MMYRGFCLMVDEFVTENFDNREFALEWFKQMLPTQRDIAECCIAVALYEIDDHGNAMIEREWNRK